MVFEEYSFSRVVETEILFQEIKKLMVSEKNEIKLNSTESLIG